MAETYGVEYSNAYVDRLTRKNYADGARYRRKKFSYTQVLAGDIADTILLCKLPAQSELLMIQSWLRWATFTATAQLNIGWAAYVDVDGVTQAASAAGLLSALVLTTASTWKGGVLLLATMDDFNPVVTNKVFNNRNEITLFATIGVAVPGIGATLNGEFVFVTP